MHYLNHFSLGYQISTRKAKTIRLYSNVLLRNFEIKYFENIVSRRLTFMTDKENESNKTISV